jgi:hypothetical protein
LCKTKKLDTKTDPELSRKTSTRPTKLAGVSNDGAKSEIADIAALSEVACGFSDNEAKSEIAANGKRRASNVKRRGAKR